MANDAKKTDEKKSDDTARVANTMVTNQPAPATSEVPANAAVVGDPEYVNDAKPRGIATVKDDDTYVTDIDYHDPEGYARGT